MEEDDDANEDDDSQLNNSFVIDAFHLCYVSHHPQHTDFSIAK